MNFIKENKWFALAGATTLFLSGCLLKDAISRLRQSISPGPHSNQKTGETDGAQKPIKKELSSDKKKIPFYRICITGGPCAGKTSALAFLKQHLSERGFEVYIVPETPTLTMYGGGMIIMANLSQEKIAKFQSNLMKLQISLEDYFTDIAFLAGKPSVIICDRGVMDPYAYVTDDTWDCVLNENGWNTVNLRDKRYDAVIHMVTAADGAEEFYRTTAGGQSSNNNARYEDVETARKVDKKTQMAWTGHFNFTIIDNSGKDFNEKLFRVYDAITNALSLPGTSHTTQKYLLKSAPKIPKDIKCEEFSIEDTFLKSEEGVLSWIRKRGQNDHNTYMYVTKIIKEGKEGNEQMNIITPRDAIILMEVRDKNFNTILRNRISFVIGGQNFSVDSFPSQSLHLCRVERAKDRKLIFPEFLNVGSEVTDDSKYRTYNMAKIK